VQVRGDGGAAEHQRQGQHHRGLMFIHLAQQVEHAVAQRDAQQDATDRLLGEQQAEAAQGRHLPETQHPQQDAEQHHRGAVIEQRLADDGGLQRLGRAAALEDAHGRDRIGRRNQRAEQQAVDEIDMPAEQLEDEERQPGHHEGRDQHATGGQYPDGPFVAAQVVEVDMQGTGEQQGWQEPGHQHRGEIDAPHDFLHLGFENRIAQRRETQGDQRENQGRQHHADGRRQAQEAVIDVGEEGREGNERRCQIKHRWAPNR